MATSRYVRFSGGPPAPTVPGLMPSPGQAIVAHLLDTLPRFGVQILGHEDVEYAHDLRCRVGPRVYVVSVSYDWVQQGWWEVFWEPALGFLKRLLGQSEDNELRRLALAVSQALDSLPGVQEKRWYPGSSVGVKPGAVFTHAPEF